MPLPTLKNRHSFKKQRQQRRIGIMRKADQLRKLCRARVAIFVQDADGLHAYRSHDNWHFDIEEFGEDTLRPEDFTTVREAATIQAAAAIREESDVSQQLTLDETSQTKLPPMQLTRDNLASHGLLARVWQAQGGFGSSNADDGNFDSTSTFDGDFDPASSYNGSAYQVGGTYKGPSLGYGYKPSGLSRQN